MKNILFLLVSVFMGLNIFGQNKIDEQKKDIAFYNATNKWFSAWKLASKEIYQIDQVRPVELFFLKINTSIQLLQ